MSSLGQCVTRPSCVCCLLLVSCFVSILLQGDVDALDGDESRTEKFNSSISKLIPDGFNLEWELKQVHTSWQLLFCPSFDS